MKNWTPPGSVILAIVLTVIRGQNNTCENRCDDGYIPNLPCYCNDACYQYENCCLDYYSLCRPELVWSDEWHVHNNHSYRFFHDVVTGEQAIERCRNHGALLVSINSQEEQAFLGTDVLKKRTVSGFIGATDRNNEDIWMWADGTSVPRPGSDEGYENWYDGQPDDGGGSEDCGIISIYAFWEVVKVPLPAFFWLDHSCTINAQDIQGYICERTLACDSQPCLNNGTCQYIGGDAEYECICPEGFVREQCQTELIDGAPWNDCGATYLTENEGTIQSPLYPEVYPPNVLCRWTVEVAEGKTLSMVISELELEYVKNCVFDSLLIYDGDTSARLLLEPLCGVMTSSNDMIGSTLRSSSNRVVVEFKTDSTVHQRGFALDYSANDCGTGTGDSGCGTQRLFTANCAYIHVTTGPSSNGFCDWQINVPQGHVINVTFTDFNIEDTSLSCDQGGLTFHDGPDSSANVIETYCGKRFSWYVISSGRDVYMRLEGLSHGIPSVSSIKIQYETVEPSAWQLLNPIVTLRAPSGSISTSTSSPHALRGGNTHVFQWRIQVPIGELLGLMWEIISFEESTLRIYDGDSEYSSLLYGGVTSGAQRRSGELQATSFRVLVIVERAVDDIEMSFSADFFTRTWTAVESGCYTPFYVDQSQSQGTENNPVTPLEPVVVLASEHSYDIVNPGYDAGDYCRALIKSNSGVGLQLSVLDGAIVPKSRDCAHDGVVIYEGETTSDTMHGPFCGSSVELLEQKVTSVTGSMLVVFYSDTRGERRSEGIFRALVAQTISNSCAIYQLDSANTQFISAPANDSIACGVVLSPNFPGLVKPSQWLWRIEGFRHTYFTVNVYYVKGPGFESDCQEFFRVLEVSRDAKDLQQIESILLKACGQTELFVPPRNIKIPKGQKLGIELNTLKNTAARQWQFKLSYVSTIPEVPNHITSTTETCPPDDYHYFRGSCYRYINWVRRHYEPDIFDYQETWEKALAQCEADGATLVSIHDEEEAEFIKHKMSDDWLWDPAATWQCNHRIVYIGLHNREGHYQWTDGTALAYSDWYVRGESWEQPLLHEDTRAYIIDVNRPQPSADESSLCSVLVAVSPFKPFNWAKIPCDYPMFRAGVLCEKPATPFQPETVPSEELNPSEILLGNYLNSVQVCPLGWNMVSGHCIRMRTNYTRMMNANADGATSLSLTDARSICQAVGGTLADVTDEWFHDVIALLRIWRHTDQMGHIWLGNENEDGVCQYIKVYKHHFQDDIVNYERDSTENCTELNNETRTFYSALCSIAPAEVTEACAPGEFICDNRMCTSADNVCDGEDDCRDNSDEIDCENTFGYFACDNGRNIPLSLRCDFQDQCGDGSDETRCVMETCGNSQFQCQNGECIAMNRTCDFWLDCADGSDETSVCDNACRGFLCYSGRCLDDRLRRDSVSDCPGQSQEDELNDIAVLSMFDVFFDQDYTVNETTITWCNEGMDHVQCRPGEPRCYERGSTCRYDDHMMDERAMFSVQDTCRTGDHLRNSCEFVQCPREFHCPGSYCLPFDKVCDGMWHCPGGEDENNCSNYICPGLFQCKGESFCLPRSKVCNGIVDCLVSREDEKYCNDVDPLCADVCQCNGFSLECSHSNVTSLALPQRVNGTRKLRSMQLAHNNVILVAGDFNGLHWLAKLDISHNGLESLPDGIFLELRNLFELDISNNLLTTILAGSFEGLISLQTLDLSSNRLRTLENDNFIALTDIRRLILTNNMIDAVDEDTFTPLKELDTLNTDAYKFCCIATQVESCTPEPDEFSSCEDLLSNKALQLSIWMLGVFAFVGNLFVVIWRLKTDSHKVSSFLIINLGLSDFLMGVYMLIIASADVYYRGSYILFADKWRNGWLCQVAGIFAMLSSEVSVFMMSAITADRMVAILFPMKTGRFRLRHARYVAGAGWLVCLFLSLVPAMGFDYFGGSFFGRTGVCLPFHLSNDHLPGWEYSVFIFLVINLISFIFIFFGYLAIFLTVKSSLDAMGDKSTTTTNEYDLAKKLAIIVATDFLCWVPIILIGFAALAGAKIPPVVSAWIAVFVLPLNSAVNPLLYTISAINCEGAAAKRRRRSRSIYSYGASTRNTRVSTINTGGKSVKYDNSTALVKMNGSELDEKAPV